LRDTSTFGLTRTSFLRSDWRAEKSENERQFIDAGRVCQVFSGFRDPRASGAGQPDPMLLRPGGVGVGIQTR